MSPTNSEILRAYTRQFDGQGHTSADHEQTLCVAMDLVSAIGMPNYDIDNARDDLVRHAARYGVPVNEYVAALDLIAAHTGRELPFASHEIHRVLTAFRDLQPQLVEQ